MEPRTLKAEERDALRSRIDEESRRRLSGRAALEREYMDEQPIRESPALPLAEPSAGSCRTPGCPNAANARHSRGVYSGLCEAVCIPARRAELSAKATADHAARREGRRANGSGDDLNQTAHRIVQDAVGEEGQNRWSKGGRPQRWTSEAVVDGILAFARENGHYPSSVDLGAPHDERFPSYKAVVRACGSFESALEEAGCPRDASPRAPYPAPEELGLAELAAELERAEAALRDAERNLAAAAQRFAAYPLVRRLAEDGLLAP